MTASRKPGGASGAPSPTTETIAINRAPVLTLWAAVVAERLGYDPDGAATLGRAVAGMNAQSKARRLRIFAKPGAGKKAAEKKRPPVAEDRVELLGRSVSVVRTRVGIRAAKDGRPDDPAAVQRYLEGKFGDALDAAREAMHALARSVPKAELEAKAFELYETFRPTIPAGQRGWGAKGMLDLGRIRALARAAK